MYLELILYHIEFFQMTFPLGADLLGVWEMTLGHQCFPQPGIWTKHHRRRMYLNLRRTKISKTRSIMKGDLTIWCLSHVALMRQ